MSRSPKNDFDFWTARDGGKKNLKKMFAIFANAIYIYVLTRYESVLDKV